MGPDLDIVDGAREDMAGMDIASRFITSNKSYDALERCSDDIYRRWSVGYKNVILNNTRSRFPKYLDNWPRCRRMDCALRFSVSICLSRFWNDVLVAVGGASLTS